MKKTLTVLMMVLLAAMLFISCDNKAEEPKNDAKYKVGDRGPAGGVIFYVADSEQTTIYYSETLKWRYLEAAPDDAPVGVDANQFQWFTGEINQAPCNGDEGLGNGWTNTKHILSSDSTTSTSFPALQTCIDYGNGTDYDDWFMPSKGELDKMYENKYVLGTFQSGQYCSSSTNGYGSVYSLNFNDGSKGYGGTYNSSYYVRPIRAFSD